MMVTPVRGHFKNVHGSLLFDPQIPAISDVEAVIDARGLRSGEPERDAHLRSADFLDVERFPEIRFAGRSSQFASETEAAVTGELTLRGVTRSVVLDVRYLGQWQTPWWEDGVDKGPKLRAGFVANTRIDRRDFGVLWNSTLARDGLVVGNEVLIGLDVEAILEE